MISIMSLNFVSLSYFKIGNSLKFGLVEGFGFDPSL